VLVSLDTTVTQFCDLPTHEYFHRILSYHFPALFGLIHNLYRNYRVFKRFTNKFLKVILAVIACCNVDFADKLTDDLSLKRLFVTLNNNNRLTY
jgi:hypothetical protein